VSVNPVEGTTLTRRAPVNIVVSLGTVVPDIVGLPLGDGQVAGQGLNAILEAGLVLGTQTPQASTTVPAGSVYQHGSGCRYGS
jgi:beta-lactam-binding protein with PASTA domain